VFVSLLIHERFESGLSDWAGKTWNAYLTGSASEGAKGLRVLFRKGSHYGTDLRQDVAGSRHVYLSYRLRFAADWVSNTTGKLPGFADLRWKNAAGKVLGHGNRKPVPDGFSFRTWFGKTKNGRVPVGMYIYHAGQKKRWGDSVHVGTIRAGMPHVLVEVEGNLDAGWIRMRLDLGDWVEHPIQVGEQTQITTAWLNGYWGGWRKAPSNMAADIDNFRLDDYTVTDTVPVSEQIRQLADTVAVMEAALEGNSSGS